MTEDVDPRIGTTLGRFRIDDRLGDGATGTVYKATELTLNRPVALKVVHSRLARDRATTKRFHREARAASHVKHPNCVEIFDVDVTEEGVPYLAMAYVEGVDLATILDQEMPLDTKRTVRIIKQVCHALAAAHEKGLIHRDIKPENIMVSQKPNPDSVKVLDFGIVKLLARSPVDSDSFETLAGKVCGTPEYMSPEQAQGSTIDGRSDLYAIGILLYELLTGQVPFEGKGPIQVIRQHLMNSPQPPSELLPGLHPKLEHLILWLLTKNPQQRPPDAKTVINILDAVEVDLNRQGVVSKGKSAKPIQGQSRQPAWVKWLLAAGGIAAVIITLTQVL